MKEIIILGKFIPFGIQFYNELIKEKKKLIENINNISIDYFLFSNIDNCEEEIFIINNANYFEKLEGFFV